jgi:transcriptional regulator with XRE-family HTH domain
MGFARGANTPQLGDTLRKLREAKGRSQEQIAIKLRALGFPGAGKALISRYEAGRAPDVGALWGLAVVHGHPFEELCASLAAELQGKAPVVLEVEDGPSARALAVARAYDKAPIKFRKLVDQALALAPPPEHTEAPDQPAVAPQAKADDTQPRPRKGRARR